MRGSSSTNPLIPLGLVSAGLVSIIAGSFASAPLVADEEWMLFWEYQEISENPSKALADLYAYNLGEPAVMGRLRVLYPITEFFGGFVTSQLQNLLGMDPMSVYGLWRVVATAFLALTFMALAYGFVSSFLPAIKVKIVSLAAVVLPVQILSIYPISAFRIFPSHYTLMGILSLGLFYASWRALIFAEGRARMVSKFFSALLIFSITLLLVTGSEFFYILGPVMVVARLIWFKFVERKDFRKQFRTLWPLFVFVGSFLTNFITIRLWLGGLCRLTESCYSRTSLEIDSGIFGEAAFRVLGRLPGVSQSVWLPLVSNFENPVGLAAIAMLVGVAAGFYVRAQKSFLDRGSSEQESQTGLALFFAGIGFTWLASSALAVASTSAFSSGGGELGYASFDLVQLTIGSSFALLGLLLLLGSASISHSFRLLSSRNLSNALAVSMFAFLAALGAASMVGNQSTSLEFSNSQDVFLQREISLRSITPPSPLNANHIRCAVLERKQDLFPRWLGHDQAVYIGLNSGYFERFGEDFCQTEADVFFSDY